MVFHVDNDNELDLRKQVSPPGGATYIQRGKKKTGETNMNSTQHSNNVTGLWEYVPIFIVFQEVRQKIPTCPTR